MTQLTLPIAWRSAEKRAALSTAVDLANATYRVGPVAIRLICDHAPIAHAFRCVYAPFTTESPDAGATAEFEIIVRRQRSRRTGLRHFHISSQVDDHFTVRRLDRVLPHVECAINLCIARLMPRYLLLHAAVATRRGIAAIFPGGPAFGKTTLAAALTARGWGYGGDEFAMIDPADGSATPHPKALSIKPGSVPLLTQAGVPVARAPVFNRRDKGAIRLLPVHAIRPNAIAPVAPVRLIVLPQLNAEHAPKMVRISRGEAVFEMARRCFNVLRFRSSAINILEELTRGAACFRMTVGELGQTCRLIERTFDAEA